MNYANCSEIWWPHPAALDALNVIETEEGFDLEAPEGTECGDWLAYFNETEERKEIFSRAFIQMLKDHIELINGENQVESDQQDPDHSCGQEDVTGAVEEHESGGDIS